MENIVLEYLRLNYKYCDDSGCVVSLHKLDRETGKPMRVGCVNGRGYVKIYAAKKSLAGHRVVWFLVNGVWPRKDMDIDHMNRIKTDNRIENLRLVSRTVNKQNLFEARKGGPNKLIGASLIKTRTRTPWRASIRIMGKLKYLGQFDTEQEAHDVYMEAKRIYH